MRASNWIRAETAAAKRDTVTIEAVPTMAPDGDRMRYGVRLRFHKTRASRLGERLVIEGTLEDMRELIAKLTEAVADGEHYRAGTSQLYTTRPAER